MRKTLSFLSAYGLFFLSLASQQKAAHTLTLKDCIDIGLQRATAVLKAANNEEIAGAQLLAAYGQFLPDLSAGAGYNYNRGNNLFYSTGLDLIHQSRSAATYQLVSTINIFSGFNNYSAWKASALNKDAYLLSLDRARQQIALDIMQSYLQVVLDRKLTAFAKDNLSTSEKREDQLKVLTDVGRRAKTDLYQQQALTSNDRLLFINTQNRMMDDKITLLRKLRIDSVEAYDIADIPIDDNPDADSYGNVEALVKLALNNRPDLKAAGLATDAAGWNIKKSKSGYLPRVDLGLGFYGSAAYFNSLSINGVNSLPSDQPSFPYQLANYNYGMINLSSSWYIFDKFVTKSNLEIARITRNNALIDFQDLRTGVMAEIRLAYNDYVSAIQQIQTVDAGLTAAQKAYEAISGRYQEGSTDFITVANAQIALLQAQQNRVQASVNMMLQKKAIDFYLGL